MTETHTLDLKTTRCPTALIRVRQALRLFIEGADSGSRLLIQSIEPSLLRDIPYFIEHELQHQVRIDNTIKGAITDTELSEWRQSDDHDCDDYEGLAEQFFWVIVKDE